MIALLPITVIGQVKSTGFVSLGGVDATVLSVALLLAVSVVTFLRHPRYPVAQMLPYFILTFAVMIGIAMANPGSYQAVKERDFFVTTVVVCCVPLVLRDYRGLQAFLGVWFWGGTLIAALVLLVGGAEDLYGRAAIGEATLGPAYLSAAALVVGGAAWGEKLLPIAVAVPGVAISGIALVTIGSRGPMVAATIGFAAWMLLRGVTRVRSLLALLAVVVAAVLGIREASETSLSRLVLTDPARESLWATARVGFLQHPIMGLGWGDYSTISSDTYPHNLFLETAAELGLVGLLCVLALLVIAASRVWRSRSRAEVRVLCALAILMLVGQQFSADLTNRTFWIALIPCLLLPMGVEGSESPDSASGKRSYRRAAALPPPTVAASVVDSKQKRTEGGRGWKWL